MMMMHFIISLIFYFNPINNYYKVYVMLYKYDELNYRT